MSEDDTELDRLFGAMAGQAPAAEPAGERERRRERAIGGVRALQLRLSGDRPHQRGERRYWVWSAAAAALTLAGAALAATTGAWPYGRPSRDVNTAPPHSPSAPATSQRQPLVEVARPVPSPPSVAPPDGTAGPAAKTVAKATTTADPGAALEEVNRLFAEVKRARREHRDADALALLQRLLSKYPRSVLGQEASVERFRALSRLGRTSEAQRYARAYLATYPNGFAADEARRLTDPPEVP